MASGGNSAGHGNSGHGASNAPAAGSTARNTTAPALQHGRSASTGVVTRIVEHTNRPVSPGRRHA